MTQTRPLSGRPGWTEDRRRRVWEARAEWPLTILAVLFLATYALPILRPDLPLTLRSTCSVVGWGVWAIFVAEYAVRWILSENRGRFVRTSLVDLLVMALPLLRPLRMLRLLTLLDVLNRVRPVPCVAALRCTWRVPRH